MKHRLIAATAALALANGVGHAAALAVRFTYDPAGRVATALYDNGRCDVYAYDAAGNRTTRTVQAVAGTPKWGSVPLGCFTWSPT